MATELRVMLPGPEGSEDARRAVRILDKVLALLAELDHAATRRRGGPATTWSFTRLQLGSVDTLVAPNQPGRGRTTSEVERDFYRLVEGFMDAERGAGIPTGWTKNAAKIGAEIGRYLSATATRGLLLGVHENGRTVNEITVTRRVTDHLELALSSRRQSIGSLVGKLDSVNIHNGAEARLWLPGPRQQSVPVKFRDEQVDQIRDALGKRVMITGRIERDAEEAPVRVIMREIDILRDVDDDDVSPLGDLVGRDPDFTGGIPPAAYLRELRGTA